MSENQVPAEPGNSHIDPFNVSGFEWATTSEEAIPGELDSAGKDDVIRTESRKRLAIRVVGSVVFAAVVAAIATASHRSFFGPVPIGLTVALLLTVGLGLTVRAWAGLRAMVAAAIAWVVVVQVLSLPRTEGDVLVMDPTANVAWPWAGVIFSYVGVVVFGVIAFLPRRLFSRSESKRPSTTLVTVDSARAE
jgi:hypothetical protein